MLKFNRSIFFLLMSWSTFSQSISIGNIDFYPLDDSKPESALFGELQVFENNIKQEGKTITLHIEVLPAQTNKNKKTPMFILMGGPGQASSDLISFFATIFNQMNEECDLVFIDQRGTGKSNPLRMQTSYDKAQDYVSDILMLDETVKRTHQLLSTKHELSNFGTINAAIDIETVRTAMGYDKINIYSTSYGTRLALVYLNTYPNNVRTLTLKGLVPDDLIIPIEFAEISQEGLEQLIHSCSVNEECNQAFPNFENEFDVLMNQKYPISVTVTNPATQLVETIQLTKESVAMTFRSLLSVPSFTQQIPYIVSEVYKGNYKILADLIVRIKMSNSNGIYTGMRLCVLCYEDYPKILNAHLDKSSKTFLKDIWINRVVNACKIWNPTLKKAEHTNYKKHDTPVLLISGERDHATPPKYGDKVLKYFKNGKHVIVKNAGHSFDRMLNCVENVINEFVLDGTAENLDFDCINSVKFPDFKLN